MNRALTLEQRIHNAEACQTVEEYKARHAYLHGAGYSREEWDLMWLDSPNTTWAHQFGRMVGFEEVYMNSVFHMDRQVVTDKLAMMEEYPELQGHDLRSVCAGGCHALASDVMEVADDGLSVRASFLTPGTLMGPSAWMARPGAASGCGNAMAPSLPMWTESGSGSTSRSARTSPATTTTATGPMTAIWTIWTGI